MSINRISYLIVGKLLFETTTAFDLGKQRCCIIKPKILITSRTFLGISVLRTLRSRSPLNGLCLEKVAEKAEEIKALLEVGFY